MWPNCCHAPGLAVIWFHKQKVGASFFFLHWQLFKLLTLAHSNKCRFLSHTHTATWQVLITWEGNERCRHGRITCAVGGPTPTDAFLSFASFTESHASVDNTDPSHVDPAIVRTKLQWHHPTWQPYQILSYCVINEPGFSEAFVQRLSGFHLL